jgi:sialate O-acetylesterase
VQATLIRDWRELWGEGDFPFYIVQLAGQEAASNSPKVREAQATVLSLPNTGMAVATDIGEAQECASEKQAGRRRPAVAHRAGECLWLQDRIFRPACMNPENRRQRDPRVQFSHLGGGLVAKNGAPLTWFAIAGADQKFVAADAKIDGDTVVVSSPEMSPRPSRCATRG